jgi:hypothetical protein
MGRQGPYGPRTPMGRQGPCGPRTPGESDGHSKVDRRYRLYSVLKVSVAYLEAGTLRSPHPRRPDWFFEFIESHWAYSSVGLEHTPDKREVGSSNLPRPTT